MILKLTFEEITALNAAAARLLGGHGEGGAVLAPPEALAELESRLPLQGDVSVMTLTEQERLMGAVESVLDHLKHRMDGIILEQYVGSDDSVNAYFDYANVLTTRNRLARIGQEMTSVIELITAKGAPEDAEGLEFPD